MAQVALAPSTNVFPAAYVDPRTSGAGAIPKLALPPDAQEQILRENAALGPGVLHALGAVSGLFVRQDISWVELLTGCDTQNKYSAQAWNPAFGLRDATHPRDGICSEPLLRMVERSNLIYRNLLGRHRFFEMAVFAASPRIGNFKPHLLQDSGPAMSYPDSVVFERPFRISLLCWQRPIMFVRHNAYGYLGEVYSPWALLPLILHVRSPTTIPAGASLPIAEAVKAEKPGTLWYVVKGDFFQLGNFGALWCRRVKFLIYDAADTAFERPVGEISRVFGGWVREAGTVSDSLVMAFPPKATPVQRAVLLGALQLIEYLRFMREPRDPKYDRGGGMREALIGC